MDWLAQFWETLTWSRIIWAAAALIASALVSYSAIILVMVKIPADYFSSTYALNHRNDKHFLLRWGATIFKNAVGVFLVVAGAVMMLGPGPGVLTMLLGLIMMDIPGKRPLEARIIKRPAILSTINNLRARYKKPPLVID